MTRARQAAGSRAPPHVQTRASANVPAPVASGVVRGGPADVKPAARGGKGAASGGKGAASGGQGAASGGKGATRASQAAAEARADGDGVGWGGAASWGGGKGSAKRERDRARPLPAPLRTDFSIEPAWGVGRTGDGAAAPDAALGGSGGASPGSLSGGGESEGDGFGGIGGDGDGRGTDVWSSADEALGVTSPMSALSSPSLFSRLGEGLGLLAPSPGPATAARHAATAGAVVSPALETGRRSGGLLSVPLSRCAGSAVWALQRLAP